jgi:hypothetical protein
MAIEDVAEAEGLEDLARIARTVRRRLTVDF